MNKPLHVFAVITAVCTFFLIFAGGMVTSTGSALAVPDWPLSYGQLMPPMVGGIFYEHGHRMIASLVGLLTVILAIWLWRKESRRWVKMLGIVAVAAVILQGTLGGLTVLLLLPTAISVSHASLAQSFFCLVSAIALFTSSWWHNAGPGLDETASKPALKMAIILTGSVFVQLVLGAVMRHTQSGLAVPDLPFAYGSLFPSLSPDALEQYNRILLQTDIRIAADGPITASQVLIHVLHRYWAVAVTVIAGLMFFRIRNIGSGNSRLTGIAWFIASIILVQVSLGVFTVLSRRSELITTAHVATGALLLVASVLLVLHIIRLGRFSFSPSHAWFRREALAR
ncbi:MAG TPA: COX15/CtaA family protein [Bacteroidota bacterium]